MCTHTHIHYSMVIIQRVSSVFNPFCNYPRRVLCLFIFSLRVLFNPPKLLQCIGAKERNWYQRVRAELWMKICRKEQDFHVYFGSWCCNLFHLHRGRNVSMSSAPCCPAHYMSSPCSLFVVVNQFYVYREVVCVCHWEHLFLSGHCLLLQ